MYALFGESGRPSSPHDVRIEVDGHFVEAWRRFAGDPDYEVMRWLVFGAPAGVEAHSDGVAVGACQPPGDKVKEAKDVTFYQVSRTNYDSVGGDPHAKEEVEKLIGSGFADVFDAYKELLAACKGTPVLSNFKMETKTLADRVKRRLIMD